MATDKLTKTKIDGFSYAGWALKKGWSRDIRWDKDIPGFGVRVYPGNTKTFVLSYRVGGRKHLLKVGRYGVMTLDQARKRARAFLVDAGDGIDPKEQKAAHNHQGTLRRLAKAHFAELEGNGKKTVEDMRKRFNRNIPRSWLPRLASSIERSEIRGLHARIGETKPYEANRTIEILRTMFRRGISGALDDPKNGVAFFQNTVAVNPAQEIRYFTEKARKRFVTETELPLLAEQIDQHPNIYVRGALWCYLLTGARKKELLSARRHKSTNEPYVDWQTESLELPNPKSGEHQSIPLPGSAMAILQALPAGEEGNPYIFVGQRKGRHIVDINRPWGKIRGAAGLDDIRLHDLRRTVGSWLSKAGVDLNTIKHALRHASLSTTLTYARLGEEPARAALEQHSRHVMEVAGKRAVASKGEGG